MLDMDSTVQSLGESTGGFEVEAEIFGALVKIDYRDTKGIDPVERLEALLELANAVSKNASVLVSKNVVMRALMEVDSWVFSEQTLKSPGWMFPGGFEVAVDAERMVSLGLGWLYEVAKIKNWREG
tara:strand:- start:3676 stop:4053 length:378 start_codon:yes stop_codon:yes gene_type:complete